MLLAAWRSYKRAKDANSHYSVLNNAFQLIGWILGAATFSGSLAGFVFAQVTSFWANYGLAGALAAALIIFFLAAFIGTFTALLLAIRDARSGVSPADDAVNSSAGSASLALPAPVRTSATMMVAGGYAGMLPRFLMRFARNGHNAEIYLRYSGFISGIGDSGWTSPVTIRLKVIDRFIKDEKINIPIVNSHDAVDGIRWHFGGEPVYDKGYLSNTIGPGMHYRGCILLVDDQERTECCFFIAESTNIEVMPQIIGEHMWHHSYEWLDQVPPNSDVDSLFVH